MNLGAWPSSYWPYNTPPYTGAVAYPPKGGWVLDGNGNPALDYQGNPIPAASQGEQVFGPATLTVRPAWPIGWVLVAVGAIGLGLYLSTRKG